MLEVEREVETRTAFVEQLAQRGDVARQLGGPELVDRPAPAPDTYDAVVVENDLAVSGHPGITLEAGRPEAQGSLKRLDRVLRRSVAGPAVGETDRRIEQRGEPLLHERRLCQPLPPMGCGPAGGRGGYGGFVPSRCGASIDRREQCLRSARTHG